MERDEAVFELERETGRIRKFWQGYVDRGYKETELVHELGRAIGVIDSLWARLEGK